MLSRFCQVTQLSTTMSGMKQELSYRGYRFPPDIISRAVWLYHRFTPSLRDIEDLLAERGITVSYETIRQWCVTFGPHYARRIKKSNGPRGDRWFLDEVTVSIQGQRRYLWRAVDQDGDVIDILVQKRKDTRAAKRFFIKLLKSQGQTPIELTTDKLRSYAAAKREVMPSVPHGQDRYANNRAEVSHEHTREQERQMRGFRCDGHAQRFLSVHSQLHNLFRLGRHLLRATNYRALRAQGIRYLGCGDLCLEIDDTCFVPVTDALPSAT